MKDRYIYKAKISRGDEKGQWIQGDLITGDSLGVQIRTHDHSLYYGAKFVDPKTICQCTGRKDKNGKLIFEGDIIDVFDFDDDKEDVVIVSWSDEACCFQITSKSSKDDVTLLDGITGESPYYGQVIGNIHES